MATAADVMGSLFLYAAGYNVPENYILLTQRQDFRLSEKATITALSGKKHPMNRGQLEKILNAVPTEPGGKDTSDGEPISGRTYCRSIPLRGYSQR